MKQGLNFSHQRRTDNNAQYAIGVGFGEWSKHLELSVLSKSGSLLSSESNRILFRLVLLRRFRFLRCRFWVTVNLCSKDFQLWILLMQAVQVEGACDQSGRRRIYWTESEPASTVTTRFSGFVVGENRQNYSPQSQSWFKLSTVV